MEDDPLKRLRSSLDETVFKEQHFTDKNRQAVLDQIRKSEAKNRKQRRTMSGWGTWFKPVLSAAFCLVLLVGIFYVVGKNGLMPNHQGHDNSATQPSKLTKTKSTPQASPSMREVTAVRLASPKEGWTGGKGWIAKTTDGGKNWAVQYKTKQTVQQIFALNDQEVWAVLGSDGANGPSKLLHSTDGGKTWISSGIVPNAGFLHFTSKTGQTAMMANEETQDGGRHWTRLPIPKDTVGNAYFHDPSNGWVVTYANQTMHIQKTTDGGQTWNPVMTKQHVKVLKNAIIRSAGTSDAWIELIGGSGMSQRSYSVLHTTNGGKSWQNVLAHSTSGGGPAPGFGMSPNVAQNSGSAPGAFYVASTKVAFMGGECQACSQPNTIGWTKDGGKSWQNGTVNVDGHGRQLLAIANALNGWWIINDPTKPAVMYTTSNGGKRWTKVHSFK